MEHNNGILNDDAYVSAMVSERSPELEYVGGYSGRMKPITVRNKNCGHVYEQNYHSVVHKGGCFYCPLCAKERKKQKEKQKQKVRKKKVQKQTDKLRQVMFVPCVHCGTLFIPKTRISTCCSIRCSSNESKKRSRRGGNGDSRLHGYNVRDWNISLKDLSIRDEDICWLCGKQVDWNDYTMRGDTFIAGNFYPSIDHVVPLARGGLHEWGNVRLAHRICNSIKKDDMVSDAPLSEV